ncbi:phosphomannomutase/phosphoglucomutase [Aquisalimonas lutea]|uniref:phosphomannomutase/phosphoglucomutase n=1 Tax=Aquisalimonas lutea TaxID=1327750 RepID=UPI0025B54821|nr:phosphomannomutase/phosphoglucomutase [Aquisalimonas lutea]MDN3516340.1 phosphomannomutase/phosphoglucomutase [Aquisalimonas lutea]
MKRGNREARQPRRQGRSGPAGIMALTAALILVVALGALWLVADGTGQARQAERARLGAATSGLLADRLGTAVADVRRRLELAAEQPAIAAAVADGSQERMNDAVATLEPAFPRALRIALVPAGFDRADRDADPPVGYALLDMLRAAERDAAPVGPEGHLLGGADAHINLVHPVRTEGAVVGHVIVALAPDWLARHLQPGDGPDGGRVELVQDGARVLARGSTGPAATAYTAAVPETSWQVRYTPAASRGGAPPLADRWFLTIAGVAAVLILLIAAVANRALGRVMPADTEADTAAEPAAPVPEPAPEEPPRSHPGNDGGIRVEELDAEPSADDTDPEAAQVAAAEQDKEPAVNVDPSLFRAYDIRGVVGRTLSADVVREIGRSIGSEAAARGCTEVVVGRDGRLSSPELAEALVEGLRTTGRHVIDIGQVPTPVMYFATHHLGTGTGVEITGSHNPPDYNGMKIMIAGETLSGEAITGLYRRIRAGDLVEGEGQVRRQDVAEDYIDAIASDITLHRPLRVVVDAGNGVAGAIAPRVLEAIGCEVEPLYCEVDGNFPNHHPDPSDPHNLEALIRLVRLQQADVGLAFDGDGDRLGVVDATGKIIWADRQMMLYARDVLIRNPGADIVFDVKCSSQLAQVITDNAGVPVMWRTGHSLIKGKLKESGAPLAGEMSGHIFFNDRWPGFDDGIYTAARLLEILSMEELSSTEVFAALPEAVSTPEIKVDLQEGEPPQVIERLVAAASFPDARVTTIDGLRVDFADGWGLVRSSNTTPCLVLRFEGDDQQALERIQARFRELLLEARPGLELPF